MNNKTFSGKVALVTGDVRHRQNHGDRIRARRREGRSDRTPRKRRRAGRLPKLKNSGATTTFVPLAARV